MPEIKAGDLPEAKPRRRVRRPRPAQPVEDRDVIPLHKQERLADYDEGLELTDEEAAALDAEEARLKPNPDIEALPQLEPPLRKGFDVAAELVAREQLELLDEGEHHAAAVLGGVLARFVLGEL